MSPQYVPVVGKTEALHTGPAIPLHWFAPTPRDVSERLRNIGGGPPPPNPNTKVTIVGKNEIYRWENLIGPFFFLRLMRPRQGCIRRGGTSEAAPEAVRQAVGGGCQSGWGRLLSVTNAIEAGTWRQGDSGWA